MTPRSRVVSSLVALLVLALGACATAASGDDPGDPADASGNPDQPDGSVIIPPPIDAAVPPDAPVVIPPIDAAAPPDAPPQGGDCGNPSCNAAASLGSLSGDTNNQQLTASGTQAAWYRVHLSEDDHSIAGVSMSFTAKLTSPAGANFDVFVYLNPTTAALECSTTFGTPSSSGNLDQVYALWGEMDLFANAAEDGRDVSIEVRPISGGCSPGQTWQLEITGNN